jgi:hypothetical protein
MVGLTALGFLSPALLLRLSISSTVIFRFFITSATLGLDLIKSNDSIFDFTISTSVFGLTLFLIPSILFDAKCDIQLRLV